MTACGAYSLTKLNRTYGTYELDTIPNQTIVKQMKIPQPYAIVDRNLSTKLRFSALPTKNACDIIVQVRKRSGEILTETTIDPETVAGLGVNTDQAGWSGEVSIPFDIQITSTMSYTGDIEVYVALKDRVTFSEINLSIQPDVGITEDAGYYLVGRSKVINSIEGLLNLALNSIASSSYCFSGDTNDALNDGIVGISSSDWTVDRHSFYPNVNDEQWLEYDFASPVTVDMARVYWYVDNNCDLPQTWYIEYHSNGQWHKAEPIFHYETAIDNWSYATFEAFNTEKIRMSIDQPYTKSVAVTEWQLFYSLQNAELDNTPPNPDPMIWEIAPYATGDDSVSMTAIIGSDISGVQYYFDEISGNPGGSDSGWQNSPVYTNAGLSPDTQYTYLVKARDKSPNHNETGFSMPLSATTNTADTTPPSPNPMTWDTVPYATGYTSIAMIADTASDISGVEYYFIETSGNPGGSDSGWQNERYYEDTGLQSNTTYTYQVQARDKSTAQNITAWSTPAVSATTESAVLVDLKAADLLLGMLTTWINEGTLGGSFGRDGTSPLVDIVDGHKAVSFDGSDHMISTFSAPAGITGNSDWSIEMWVYNPSIADQETVVQWAARGGPAGTAAHLGYGTNTSWGAIVHWGGIPDMGFDGGVPSAGDWHHIVATYEGGSGTETIYVDGVPNASENKALELRVADPIYLGISWDWNTTGFWLPYTGSIAEVRIYDNCLNAGEILDKFNTGISD